MHYHLTCRQLADQFLDISLTLGLAEGSTLFSLPKWRPGRYELQNFARNLADLRAQSTTHTPLVIKQIRTHTWELCLEEAAEVTITYRFYANLPDAGGTFLSQDGLLFNGITCLLYVEGREDEACRLSVELPEGWQMGGGPIEGRDLLLENYHQLVDTPLLASKDLQHRQFDMAGIPTHLWFWGDCKPDWDKIEQDVRAYTRAQLAMFGDFPVPEYHYLYVMWPYPYRHGVEHAQSTVISMGPGFKLMEPKHYESFLEISSHELFHVWNVKALRPQEMLPYDYSRENYSELHYITEGVTTYYGDLMLWKGGVYSFERWIDGINKELQRHYMTGGQPFVSLTQASFQSWTHGYQAETFPNRKISFYTKGFLVAMLLDMRIRIATRDECSLDDVMREMYESIAQVGKGYRASDFQEIAEKISGEDLDDFFAKFYTGTAALEPALGEMAQYMGLVMLPVPPPHPCTAWWGIRVKTGDQGATLVDHVYAESPAALMGVSKGDELIAVAGRKIDRNLNELLSYLKDNYRATVHFFHNGRIRTADLPLQASAVFRVPQFILLNEPDEEQLQHRSRWQAIFNRKVV